MNGVSFTLDVTTTMAPLVFDSPFGGRIEHKDAELVDVKAKNIRMGNPNDVVYTGSTIEFFMYTPTKEEPDWQMIHELTQMLLPSTFVYAEAEEALFRKVFDVPNGRLTRAEMVELIVDFERTSGHRAHKSWFGGIDCKWVNFEGIIEMFEGVYCIKYGC